MVTRIGSSSGRGRPRLRFAQPRVSAPDTRRVKPAGEVASGIKLTDPFYGSAAWQSLRAAVIRERGRLCEICRTAGRVYVDHIVERRDGGAPLDKANLQVLCATHHGEKTQRERGRRAHERFGEGQTHGGYKTLPVP